MNPNALTRSLPLSEAHKYSKSRENLFIFICPIPRRTLGKKIIMMMMMIKGVNGFICRRCRLLRPTHPRESTTMAARLLSRSKTLSIARLFHPSSSSLVDTARVLHSLACPPFLRPLHDSRSAVPMVDSAGALPRNALVDSSRKIWVYEQISQSHPVKLVHTGTQGFPHWFSGMVHGGTVTRLSNNIISQLCNSTETNLLQTTCNGKDGDCSKVIAFSPLEGSHLKQRKSVLGNESSKIKRMELSQKITYALIPGLLLVSKSTATTSLLIFSIYWQIYGFFKEIFLDYVHQEVTQKWVLIYFKLLLLILAKDTILDFDLV